MATSRIARGTLALIGPAAPGTTAEDRQPELRPKRPLYTTYAEIIRTLVVAATTRIKQDKQPDPVPPVPTSRRIRALAQRYKRAKQIARKAEATLSNMNLNVHEDGRVEWSYSYRNRCNEKPGAARQKRLDVVAKLRVAATIDTMDMTPARAKAYLLRLERRLSEI